MASELGHVNAANRNQQTIMYLSDNVYLHCPWIVTIAFYKAVHVVESVFIKQEISNSNSHESRNKILKNDPRFRPIWAQYKPLYNMSVLARYLSNNNKSVEAFGDGYRNVGTVVEDMLFSRLRKIEEEARKVISKPDELTCISECNDKIKAQTRSHRA